MNASSAHLLASVGFQEDDLVNCMPSFITFIGWRLLSTVLSSLVFVQVSLVW